MDRTEIQNFITETYSANAEYPFLKYPDFSVYRHANNKKWFAVVMNVRKSKLGLNDEGAVDILNLKCDPIISGSIRSEKGFYSAYHMSKTNWISVALDGSADDEKIKWLIDISFELTAKKIKNKRKEKENV